MISKNERYYAEMVLDVIDNVECPMLMYEDEKAIVRKALKAYIENNDTADTPQTETHELRTNTHACVSNTSQTDCEDTSCPYFKNPDYSRCMKCKSQTDCAWK